MICSSSYYAVSAGPTGGEIATVASITTLELNGCDRKLVTDDQLKVLIETMIIIFEGTLDRFPGLRIIAAHGGGYLGSYAAVGDHACFVSPQNCNPNITLKKKPSEYLNQLCFDAMVFTPEGLRHLVAQVGASQVLLGTDHPIPWEQHAGDHV